MLELPGPGGRPVGPGGCILDPGAEAQGAAVGAIPDALIA